MRWPERNLRHGNTIVEVEGIKFRSKLEAKRYLQLKDLEARGIIWDLEKQVRFPLHIGDGKKLFDYIIDFTYRAFDMDGVLVEYQRMLTKAQAMNFPVVHIAEDVKGFLEYHTKIKYEWARALNPHIKFQFWPEKKLKEARGKKG